MKNQRGKFLLIRIHLILFLSGVLFSCENQKIIEEEQFVEVYAKLTLIKELYRDDQAQFFKEREKIFNEYKIDKQKLDATFNYYNEDPERWKLFYEKVINYLDKLQKESTVN